MLKKLIILTILFLCAPAFADEAVDKAEFKRLYAEFNELYANSEDIDPIIEVAEKLIDITRKAYGKNHMNNAVVIYNLASLYVEKSEISHNQEEENKTTELFEKYFSILEKNDAPKDRTYVNQYLIYLKASVDDHTDESIKSKAIKIQKVAIDNDYELHELAHIENSVALLLFKNRQYQAAKDFFEYSSENYLQAYGPDHFKVGETLFALARLEMGWKKREVAENLFLRALDIFEKNDELGHSLSQSSHAFLVGLYEEMGKPDDATKHCQAVAVERPRDFDLEIEPIYRLIPKYPPRAAEDGKTGHVILEFDVDTNGITKDIRIVESSARMFEKSSREALEKWRYAPSVKNGELVVTDGARARIEYRLR